MRQRDEKRPQAHSLRYQLKAKRFPIHRDLTGFDWSETPLDGARIQDLAKGHYLETAHNLILVGGTGTGKTQLAVIPPFLARCIRRIHAAIFSFWAGVMPPMPMFGRSLL